MAENSPAKVQAPPQHLKMTERGLKRGVAVVTLLNDGLYTGLQKLV